jgi:uncharacterized protein YndB with AHSA1/START domain
MRLLLITATVVAVLVAALFGIAFLLPDEVHVERSTRIAAAPATVFATVNSFQTFDRWSPWADLDPEMKVELSGPPAGVGARYTWHGNAEAGSGHQEIIESTPDSMVKIRLDFDGFDQASTSTITITPDGSGSSVTWAFDSSVGSNPMHRWFGLLMKKYVGEDYAKGLARLKTLLESGSAAAAAAPPAVDDGEPHPGDAPAAAGY